MVRRIVSHCTIVAVLLLLGGQVAKANSITYTFQGFGTGSLGTTSFTNSFFRIKLTADTSSIMQFTIPICKPSACTIFTVQATSAAISVAGLMAAITSPVGIFDNQTFMGLGLGRRSASGPGGGGPDFLDIGSSVFANYNLAHGLGPIGPFTGGVFQFKCSFGCVTTGLGNLSMSNASGVTFAASPEPASMLLFGSGALFVAGIRRRKSAR